MGKRQHHAGQIVFDFGAAVEPRRARGPASLAGWERQISAAVSEVLHRDDRRREVIAAEMSVLLDEEISKAMLDAYASPAREGHKVPLSRFGALVSVSNQFDQLGEVLSPLGVTVLVGEEIYTAKLGHLRQQQRQIAEDIKALERMAPLIRGERAK